MTRVPLNDLGRTPDEILDALGVSVRRVLDRGWYLKGPETEAFEALLSSRMGNRPVVAVANGTDALYLALAAADIGIGKRVITVANAGGYTTGVLLRLGAEPVFVDVEAETAQMSTADLETVLGQTDADAVVMTHLYGLVGEVEKVAELCSARGGLCPVNRCHGAWGSRRNVRRPRHNKLLSDKEPWRVRRWRGGDMSRHRTPPTGRRTRAIWLVGSICRKHSKWHQFASRRNPSDRSFAHGTQP